MHIAEILASRPRGRMTPATAELERSSPSSPKQIEWPKGDFPAAAQTCSSTTRSCARTCATPPTSSSAKRANRGRRDARLAAASRERQRQIRQHTLDHLDDYLEQFEAQLHRRRRPRPLGRDAAEANAHRRDHRQAERLKRSHQDQVDDHRRDQLNPRSKPPASRPYETDLAELIIQLGNDKPSHIVVARAAQEPPADPRDLQREMNLPDLGEPPKTSPTRPARYLREKFLRVKTGVSGANFLIAETGGVCVVESEGNGRMCLTLPETSSPSPASRR
jgi:L-lactate utilization protein LutB